MNVTDPAKAKKRFEALQIRSLRHKSAAHGTAYNNPQGGKEAHVPIRFDLGDWEVASINNSLDRRETVKLGDAIEAHARVMVDIIDEVMEKAIKTLFKGDQKRHKEFSDTLSDLRIEKNGGIVFKGADGAPRMVITFVGPPTHTAPRPE